MKKRIILVIFLLLTVACAVWAQDETNKGEDASKRIEKLQKQVTELEKRIETLEKKIKWLSKRSVEIPETFPKLHKIPKGWREHEFNGVKYYIIPVKSDTPEADRQKK